MTCTTCGRENPPHLTFCQECGQRLGPRIAPPTPPIGLGVDAGLPDPANIPSRLATSLGAGPPSAAAAEAQRHAQAEAQRQPAQQAPHASAPPQQPPPAPPHRPSQQANLAATTVDRRCRICATPNGPNLRYCTSCGSTLEPSVARMAHQPSPAPAPAPFAAAGPSAAGPAPAPFQSAPLPPQPAPIAPMRVVDLHGGRAPADGPRACTRCRGVVDGGAQFCKFCGAPLADAAPQQAPTPARDPLASPQHPAPAPSPGIAPHLPHERPRPNGVPPTTPPPPLPRQAAPEPREPATPPSPLAVVAGPIPGGAGAAHGGAAQAPPPPRAHAPAPAQAPPQAPAPAQAPAEAAAAVSPVAPAARAITRGRLVVIAKSGADGPSYPIGDAVDVGRSEGQIIVGEDPYLSPRHVRIAWTGSKLVLLDLASTNGVYIRLSAARDMSAGKASGRATASGDSAPLEVAVPLQDQDLILVGQQVLRFESIKDGEAGFGPATEHGTLLFGSPAAPRYARLSQRSVEGVTRDVYYVRKVETVLGRESGDVVFTEDPFLSRRHAAIRVLGANGEARAPHVHAADAANAGSDPAVQFALVDLGSSNGSFLRIRNEIELVHGDQFRVGQQLFRVDVDNETREPRGRAG